jgi:hypothetical protein
MEHCGDYDGTNRRGEPCGKPAGWGTDFGDGKCRHHRGTSPDGSSHEGNTNAATHGAYSKSFVSDFLRDDEIERVEQAEELLGTPEGAKGHARLMAAIAIEQFRRSGDDRFLRRYESICDKAGIFPDDELNLNIDGLEAAFMADLRRAHDE